MSHVRRLLLARCAAVVLAGGALAAQADDCSALKRERLPGARIVAAKSVKAGPFEARDGTELTKVPAFCRVEVVARPSPDSHIGIEVWLPPPSTWNGRLWGVGNGTWGGYIPYRALNNRLAGGYAVVGTDTGHRAAADDSSWARGHPQKVVDYGFRATHEAAVAAKRVIAAYYGRVASRAYFGGCSTGGRHGLMEAQRYPGDYDGIIAGDADYDSTRLYAGIAQKQSRWLADPSRALPARKMPALHEAVLAACDAQDGVRDGVIENPLRCAFDPAALACRGAETDQCFTPPEIASLHAMYDGVPEGPGHRAIPGYALGSESNWEDVHLGTGPGTADAFHEAVGFYRDLVFDDPDWDFGHYDPARDDLRADRQLGAILNADDPDLAPFAARGGKLILFHGWSDPAVASMSTLGYHRRVVDTMGAPAADAAVRLFMVPGMGHCTGGDGPSQFGQFAHGEGDPDASLGAALQRWVEEGVAPQRIVATQREDDRDPTSTLLRTHPVCAWPQVAHWRGTGDAARAENYDCVVDE